MPTFTNERESFYCTIEKIIEDKTKTLPRTKLDTTIGFPKYLMFPHSSYSYPTMSPLAPSSTSRSSSHLYSPRIVFTNSSSSHNFFPSWPRILYRDISNNFPYSIRKFNITIIYQPRNILYNILYKKKKLY